MTSPPCCLLLLLCRMLLHKELDAVKGGEANLQVYCSPFSRTVETATLAVGKAGLTDHTARFQVSLFGGYNRGQFVLAFSL